MSAPPEFVRLTDAANVMEAGAIRALFQDNGIDCYVKGENHAALLGSFAPAIGFDIMVRYDDVERAHELLLAFRHAEPVEDLDALAGEAEHPEGDAALDDDAGSSPGPKSATKSAVLAIVPSFGFGHFYTGAFQRGVLLAAVELFGIAAVSTGTLAGLMLCAGAVATDLLGSMARARAINEAIRTAGAVRGGLPEARVVERD